VIERANRTRPEADPRFVSLVRAAQVRHLYAAQMVGLPGNLAGVVLATVLQATVAPTANVMLWAAFAAGVFSARIALGIAFRRRAAHSEDLTRWEHRYLATSFASGVIWALYGTFLFPYGGPNHETAGVIIMVGLAAGGVSTLSASRRAYLLYMLPTLLPLLVYFATGTGTSHWVLFTGVLVYIVFLAGASRNMHESIVEGFQRRFAMDALVADLTQAQEKTNAANAHLSQVLTEQTAILEAATVGIAQVRAGVVEKCNPRMHELLGHAPETMLNATLAGLGVLAQSDEAARIEAALAAGQRHEGDHELVRRDGSRFWCHIKATPIDPAAPAKGAIWVFVDVQERIEADRRIRHLAHHDPLTGLPNRILLRDRLGMALAQARRHELLVCLLLVDLDGFKSINDQHGHDAGDAVLVEVGRRVAQCVREEDTVARLGGDEFVVVLGGLRSRDHCATIARKLITVLAAPIDHRGRQLSVGASIGIAVFPDDAVDADALMRCADTAMYRIKVRRGSGFCYYGEASAPAAD
jgi:diguanylate cyclase (GGDEF)-like protein/PAS domain S-box-containing protein